MSRKTVTPGIPIKIFSISVCHIAGADATPNISLVHSYKPLCVLSVNRCLSKTCTGKCK